MNVRELIDFLQRIADEESEVEIMNVYGDLGPIEHIQKEDGKVVIY